MPAPARPDVQWELPSFHLLEISLPVYLSAVPEAISTLSEREKEVLRLLVCGHDAKSIALELRISVHTVSDRLRTARRKLGVSSSREAARLLARAEASGEREAEAGGHASFRGEGPARIGPQISAHRRIGVATAASGTQSGEHPHHVPGRAPALIWLGGGMLIMSLVIAVLALLSTSGREDAAGPLMTRITQESPSSSAPAAAQAEAASLPAARAWIELVDAQDWAASWRNAGEIFQSQVTQAQWAQTVEPVRGALGEVRARDFAQATKASTLPGVPTGEYEVIEFRTRFANRSDAVETVVMARGNAEWKPVGYFIR